MGFDTHILAATRLLNAQPAPSPTHPRLGRAVNLATDDVDAAFTRIEAAGADVAQEPIDQDYGVRDCAFRDPAGNMIRLQQEI